MQLVLSTGAKFFGYAANENHQASGELVFNTAMVGYTEALTDPSYFGQILIFTYPHIGNYGIPQIDKNMIPSIGFESHKPQVAGVVLSSECEKTSHWSAQSGLRAWLEKYEIPILSGIDTRHLVSIVRSTPQVLGRIEHEETTNSFFDPSQQNILSEVSISEPLIFGKGKKRVAIVDCGLKWNIVRRIVDSGCEVTIYPWNWDLSKVDSDSWVISNGPGDPKNTGDLVSQVKKLLKQTQPILGICLGHQILALAAGADTQRMPFGHRGLNHPVYEVGTKRGFITSQNHGFEVKKNVPQNWKTWFVNANDESVEGIQHESLPFWGIQFHPEAAPGPREAKIIFQNFLELK